jgi:predicted permease
MTNNLKLAFRTLFKTPLVTSVAILSLALGIGANAAIFSLFNQLLLRPLPVHDPGELVNLSAPGPKPGSTQCNQAGDCEEVFSYPMFRDLERVQTVFTGIAAHRGTDVNLAYRGQTLNASGLFVSGSYFPTLGIQPALGRLLGPDDDRAIGGEPVVVLTHTYWRTRFDSNPGVLNETLIVNGQAMTIVGVAPDGFDGTTLGTRLHIFVPITMRGVLTPTAIKSFERREAYWVYLFARLKAGVTIDEARTAMNVPYHAILNDVEAPLQKGMSDQTMARFRARQIGVSPGARGQSTMHAEARTPLLILMGVTGFVLLIACANIANLLLARAAGRANEMAVRLSIGASRRQLVSQLLTESCLLAILGGVAGLVVARWTLSLIQVLLPTEAARSLVFALDGTVLVFAAALSLGTGLLFGLFPAIHTTRPDLASTIKSNAGQPSGSRGAARFRTSLATVQIALSMALLVSAALFTRSLANISRVDLGVKIDNVVSFGVSPRLNGYSPERTKALFEQLEDALSAVPGVNGVSASQVPLINGDNWGNSVMVQGFEAGPDTDRGSRYNGIGPDYFRTLGIPLLAGREFSRADALAAPKVAIVNEAFAKKFNLGRDVVGKRMGDQGRETALDMEIVGLVPNTKYSEVKQEPPPIYYRPYRQDAEIGGTTFLVRTALAPEQLLAAIPPVVARIDANLPVEDLRTMPQQIKENVFLDRFITTLSAAFASLATLLAAIGLYGVLAYTVAQRTREIGLRMALGADGGHVRGMVLRQVGWMTLIGGIIGLAGAVGIGQLAKSLLYQMEGSDPTALAGAAIVLVLVALVAGFIPAQRASRIDPMKALRYE